MPDGDIKLELDFDFDFDFDFDINLNVQELNINAMPSAIAFKSDAHPEIDSMDTTASSGLFAKSETLLIPAAFLSFASVLLARKFCTKLAGTACDEGTYQRQ
uniref:Uncharacterized protein n=1 Tax=Favella ehrenbergii TaxID=182087 RepID=A0A7S3I726_9SPIT|mmetsp:Transcript_6966/g.8388  ORF Transcript_6966/g.8388 Transcript_6966/m.8388 type:complete len:102 (+) Transcript_6966:409-714(+)